MKHRALHRTTGTGHGSCNLAGNSRAKRAVARVFRRYGDFCAFANLANFVGIYALLLRHFKLRLPSGHFTTQPFGSAAQFPLLAGWDVHQF